MKKVKFSHILPMILFVISAIVFSVAAIAGGSADRAHADGALVMGSVHTVSYDANGATGGELPTEQTEYAKGSLVTVSGNTGDLENTGLLFVGWNTASDGSGTWFDGGDTFEMGEDVTLYAQWSLFEGHGTKEDPYLIKTSADWDALSEHINGGGTTYNGKHFKLTDDITITTVLGCRPAGSDDRHDRPFVGYFDGDGHTLNADIEKAVFAAPFGVVNDSVIENLTVTGTVRSANNHPAGLVAAAKGVATEQGTLTIRNVTVSADVICGATHVAGVIGHVHGTNVTMENVVFNGSMTASSIQGGFIGWGGLNGGVRFNATFKDCMFDGTYRSGVPFYPVAYEENQGNVILVNDFYSTKTWSGGSPVPETGDGKVRYVVATVEKEGVTTYYDSVSTAVENWVDGSTLRLLADVTTSSTVIVNNGEKTLDLNGHGIIKTGSGSVIRVTSGATLNLYDLNTETEHRFTVSDAQTNGAGLATVNDLLTENYLTFTGGYVTGGVGGNGGGVYCGGGTFNMYGGTIIGNFGGSRSNGGGVAVIGSSSSFNMYGGSIAYNKGETGGGLLVHEGASFTLVGGSISHNQSTMRGGAVFANGTITISGGEISDNYCAYENASIDQWGGTIVITGGVIKDNLSTQTNKSGIRVNSGVSLGGEPIIVNNKDTNGNQANLYIESGKVVTIIGALGDAVKDNKIGVTMAAQKGVFTKNWSEYMGDADPADYFYSQNENYEVFLNKGGEAEIGFSHVHDGVTFNNKWNITTSLPTSAGNYYLTCDVTISSTWNVPSGTTNLCLNGHSITRTGASDTTGSVIRVGGGATLNLYDCGTEIRYYTVEDPSQNGAGLGTVVEKSVYDEADEIARGTFEGGYITGGVISGTADGNHLIGGGVNVDGGAFTMYGGTIIGNKVCINGGAVKVKGNGASFTMNGGALIANYNDRYGGAVSVGDNNASRLCTLIINGGIIARNKSGMNGGAIHIDGKGHNLIITGGSIVDNYTGGNYSSGGNFTPALSGGAVIADGGYLKISGEPVISGNMQGDDLINDIHLSYRYDRKFMELSGGLGDGADVGVYYKGLTSSSDIKVAFGAVKEDLKHLHFDIPEEGTLVFCDGEKDWFYLDGVLCEVPGTHHTHEEGTIWACANPVVTLISFAGGEASGEMNKEILEGGATSFTLPLRSTFVSDGEKTLIGWKLGDNVYAPGEKAAISGDATFTALWADGVTLYGKVYLSDGVTPLSGATVTLIKGNKTVDYVKTDADGKYDFTVLKGVYNVVTQNGDVTKTILVTLFVKTEKDVAMPGGKTESVLKVDDEDGHFGVAVGGLDEEAQAIRDAENVPDGTDVSLTMTVGRNADKTAAGKVYESAPDKALEFFEIKVEKTIGSETTVIDQTAKVLEIAVPYAKAGKREIRVYSYHDNAVRTFTASTTKEDGTFYADAENGIVYVYTKTFSTYAIAYTPYYDISGTVTLGAYGGTYQVTVQSLDGKKTFTFENVEIGAIDLKAIPMGQYVMTVTWTDGATNTITMDLDLGEEYAQGDGPATSEPKTSLLTETAEVVFAGDTVGDITDGEIRFSACEGSLQPTTPPSEEESSPALPEAQTPDKVTVRKDEE